MFIISSFCTRAFHLRNKTQFVKQHMSVGALQEVSEKITKTQRDAKSRCDTIDRGRLGWECRSNTPPPSPPKKQVIALETFKRNFPHLKRQAATPSRLNGSRDRAQAIPRRVTSWFEVVLVFSKSAKCFGGQFRVVVVNTWQKEQFFAMDFQWSEHAGTLESLGTDVFWFTDANRKSLCRYHISSHGTTRTENILFSRPWLQCQTRQRMTTDCNAEIVPSGWRPWIKHVCV